MTEILSSRLRSQLRLRSGFLLTLLILAGIGVVGGCRYFMSLGEGQVALSPDEKFNLWITRAWQPWPNDPYEVQLIAVDSGEVVCRLDIIPIDRRPSQPLREASRAIHWSPDSSFADIILDEELYARLYVPGQKGEIPLLPATDSSE